MDFYWILYCMKHVSWSWLCLASYIILRESLTAHRGTRREERRGWAHSFLLGCPDDKNVQGVTNIFASELKPVVKHQCWSLIVVWQMKTNKVLLRINIFLVICVHGKNSHDERHALYDKHMRICMKRSLSLHSLWLQLTMNNLEEQKW